VVPPFRGTDKKKTKMLKNSKGPWGGEDRAEMRGLGDNPILNIRLKKVRRRGTPKATRGALNRI